MTDHAEEQEMEAEAMAAIFDTHFEILEPAKWSVQIYPESGDPSELDALNHVGCKLLITLPDTYPEDLPEFDIQIVKGLAEEQRRELKELANEEAVANQGAPSLFAVTERLREWLLENNVKGLDDVSMHAQMMRKKQQEQKAQVRRMSLSLYMLCNTSVSAHELMKIESVFCLWRSGVRAYLMRLLPALKDPDQDGAAYDAPFGTLHFCQEIH